MATGAVTEKARVFKTEHAFEWAFGIGFVLIAAAKLIAQGQPILGGVVASTLGIAIMCLYRINQSRIRPKSEQPRLGDEVYYLGLLYTLTSLCAALVSLFLLFGGEQSLEERTDEMIGSFGIALLTTMAGIVLRMTLQRGGMEGQETIIRIPHSVSDSSDGGVEIEGVTVDLERYAYELRRQLQNSTNAFASHANQAILQAKTIHAHMDEMMKAFHDGLEEKAKAELESLKAIYESVAEKAEEARQRTAAQQEGIQSALEKLEAQVKRMDDSIERILVGSGETAENLGAIAFQAKASTQAFAESGKTVTEGLNALAEATDAEKTHHAVREQLAVEMGEMFNRQAEEWVGVQQQAVEALKQMEQTNQALARLGQEAQRTNTELTILPDGIRKASEAIEHLAEITSASNAISGLEANAKVVTEQLAGIAGAGRLHEEALDATVKKLQALAEVSDLEFEGRAKLKEAIAEIAEVATTAGRYKEDLKDTEREVQRINTGLKGVQNALQDEGLRLAEVLKQAIVAFDEAKHEDNSTRNVFKRMFRP